MTASLDRAPLIDAFDAATIAREGGARRAPAGRRAQAAPPGEAPRIEAPQTDVKKGRV